MLIRFSKRIASILFMMLFASSFSISHAEAFSLSPNNINQLPQDAYQIAKITFLPEVKDSDLGWGDDSLKGDYNPSQGDCSNKDSLYTSSNCNYPKALVSGSQCPFLPGYYTQCKCLSKFNKTSCPDPYILGGESCQNKDEPVKYEKCVCPATVSLNNPNDKCSKTCEGNCIEKTCTPTANQSGCTNGTQACDDGCGGTSRKCCVPCVNKINSKPENSSYTYSSCTDGEGSKQIQTGWTCNSGYHTKNGACEKDCQIDSCSAYPLTSCPANGNCSQCTKTAQDCSTDGTRYKLDSCASGFVVSGNSCREQTCEEKGQKTCNGSCIATSECCGGCPSGKKCSNGTCIDDKYYISIVVYLKGSTGNNYDLSLRSDGCSIGKQPFPWIGVEYGSKHYDVQMYPKCPYNNGPQYFNETTSCYGSTCTFSFYVKPGSIIRVNTYGDLFFQCGYPTVKDGFGNTNTDAEEKILTPQKNTIYYFDFNCTN